MLKSRIAVDLPSVETRRNMGPIEWVRSLFGAQIDLRSGKEELTVSAFSLLEGLIHAFSKAGVTNAISLLVDKKVVYLDTNDVPDDLALIGQAAQQAGILDRKFREMHLALTHREAGLHVLFDVKIVSEVLVGGEEMSVDLSARIEKLQVEPGETAQAYAERVKAFAAGEGAIEPYRHVLDAITTRVADSLRASLPGSRVRTERAIVQLIRPNAEQIARFRHLGFGRDVTPPAYRPVPTMQRHGAYADPYFYYYYDPYYDFMSWVLISEMMHHSMHYPAWHTDHVYVVEPSGAPLFTGSTASDFANDGWVGADAVSYGADGNISVDPSIPDVSPEASGDFGMDHGVDPGGDWTGGADVGGYDGSDTGGWSSCSSCAGGSSCASSCGSSCAGSSCGSACGSSCGGSD